MFVGHYGPAASVAGGRIKLWHGFIAVQLLDILWAPAVLLGIENLRIVEGFTASNHFDLYDMPYTHSLVMAVFWSLAAGAVYWVVRRRAGAFGAMVIAALVFSHWILDFITHKPDLELWFGGPKVGLGLWENRPIAVATELSLLAIGLGYYLMRTQSKNLAGLVAPAILFVLLAVAQLIGNFSPPPGGPQEAAIAAIVLYFIFAALAAWVDGVRSLRKS